MTLISLFHLVNLLSESREPHLVNLFSLLLSADHVGDRRQYDQDKTKSKPAAKGYPHRDQWQIVVFVFTRLIFVGDRRRWIVDGDELGKMIVVKHVLAARGIALDTDQGVHASF